MQGWTWGWITPPPLFLLNPGRGFPCGLSRTSSSQEGSGCCPSLPPTFIFSPLMDWAVGLLCKLQAPPGIQKGLVPPHRRSFSPDHLQSLLPSISLLWSCLPEAAPWIIWGFPFPLWRWKDNIGPCTKVEKQTLSWKLPRGIFQGYQKPI